MDNRQKARFSAGKRTQQFTVTYATDLATVPEMAAEITDLNGTITKIETAQQVQATDTSGHTTEKGRLKTLMAETITKYTGRAVVKAKRAGLTVLAKQLDHTAFYYTKPDAVTSLNLAKATVNAIEDNAAALTNITAANITEMGAAIAAFEAMIPVAATEGHAKKAQGTNALETLLDQMDMYIDHIEDLVHSYFTKTALAEEFDLNAKLIITGTRHNSVTVHFEDADTHAPIPGAAASNEPATKTATADAAGIAVLEKISAGTQTFTATATGYQTQSFTTKVLRSTNTDVVVRMGKVG